MKTPTLILSGYKINPLSTGRLFQRWLLLAACLLGATGLQAQNGTWNSTTSGGLWSATGNWVGNAVATGNGNTADFSQVNITTDPTVVHLDTTVDIGNLVFGDLNTNSPAGWFFDDNGSAGVNTLTLDAGAPTITVNALGGKAVTLGPVIAGTAGMSKTGNGTLILTNANTITGGVTVTNGALALDFTAGTTTILPSQVLKLSGGTLNVVGNASIASSQTFASTTLSPGLSAINVPSAAGGAPTLGLGAITINIGGSVIYTGPATSTGISSSTGQTGAGGTTPNGDQTGAVAATANITTSSALVGTSFVAGDASTVGLYDFATVSAGTVIGLSQLGATVGDGGYVIPANAASLASGSFDDIVVASIKPTATADYMLLRFNAPVAAIVDWGSAPNAGFSGILVTPNVGANNETFTNTIGNGRAPKLGGHSAANFGGVVWQNNLSGILRFDTGIGAAAGGTAGLVQNGPGTVLYHSSSHTAPTFFNGGVSEIDGDASLGTAVNATTVNLNGGTVVAIGSSFTLDNVGANLRPVSLRTKGGGLGALSTFTLTVDGVISGVTGTGPLIIGIPASANNGTVLGQIPGTGTGTANASQLANGTVIVNNTGNTYTGGTVLDSGILQLTVNNLNVLGAGGITLNGGTFQWNGVTTDISARTVTLAALGGTLDLNGNTVTLASSIGNSGSGALTVASTAAGGVLTFSAANVYTGNTTVASGATLKVNNVGGSGTGSGNVTVQSGGTLAGTGAISGNVTWNTGGLALFSSASTLAISGSLTLSGSPVVTVNVPGGTPLTPGTYTLATYNSAGSSGSFNTSPAYTGAGVSGGTTSAITTSGGNVVLTVTAAGVNGVWANDLDGNWTDGTKWSSNPSFPHAAGDGATFGAGSALRTVNLNASETVGSIAMTNDNSFIITNAANTLTLDNSGSGISINVTAGITNAIRTPLALNGNVTASVSTGKSLALAGGISGSGKTLTVNGAGTTILSAASTYGPSAGSTGTTLTGGGTLQVGNNSALGAGDLSVTGSSKLQAGATLNGVNNNVAISPGVSATVDNSSVNALTLGGVVSGNGALVKTSNGTLTLGNANNTYAGGTTVNGGFISLSADGTAGSPGNLGIVPAAFTFNNLTLNSGGLLGNGTVGLNANRGIILSGTGLLDAAAGATFTVNGPVGPSLTANGITVNSGAGHTGMVVLAAADTFAGPTTVTAGTLQLGNALALQNSTLTLNGGLLDFGTLTAATIGGLSGSQNINLVNDLSAGVALTLGSPDGPLTGTTATYTGVLGGGSGASLQKLGGTGTITIGSGANGGLGVLGTPYAGVILVDAGTLILGGVGNASVTTPIHMSGNHLQGICSLIVADSSVVTTTGLIGLNADNNFANNHSPNGANLTVKNNANLRGGSLTIGGNANILSAGDFVTVQDSATLTVNTSFNLSGGSGSASTTVTSANLNGGTLTVGNIISSSGRPSIINFNGGAMQAGTNDPAGSTFLPALGSLTVNVTNTAVPAFISSSNYSVTIAANLVNGTANVDAGVVKAGTGTLVLAGNNTYTGLTTVSNGALFITSALQTGVESFKVNDNKTFGVVNTLGSGQSAQIVNLTLGHNSGPTTLVFTNVADTSNPVLNLNAGGTLTLNGNCTLKIADAVNLVAGNEYPLIGYASGNIVTNSGTGFHLSLPTGVTGVLTNEPSNLTVSLVVTSIAVPPPSFSSVVRSGGDLVLNATGGSPGASLTVLSTTDLALPLASWTVVTTGNFDGSGNFNYTVTGALNSGLPHQFYTLHTP